MPGFYSNKQPERGPDNSDSGRTHRQPNPSSRSRKKRFQTKPSESRTVPESDPRGGSPGTGAHPGVRDSIGDGTTVPPGLSPGRRTYHRPSTPVALTAMPRDCRSRGGIYNHLVRRKERLASSKNRVAHSEEGEPVKLYTKRGDDGTTDLFGGMRVPKDDLRIAAIGDVDETNAAIGVAIAAFHDVETVALLRDVQADLFSMGAELAAPNVKAGATLDASRIKRLEDWIDASDGEVPPLKRFILPGGTEAAAALHLARVVCRRAERTAVALARENPVNQFVGVYLNRLSDLLFALARRANHWAGTADIPWSASED